MKSYITSLDTFGYPIELNYKQSKGSAHKTFYGGMASLFVKLAMIVIFGLNLHYMF